MAVYELDLIYLGLEINRYGPCATFLQPSDHFSIETKDVDFDQNFETGSFVSEAIVCSDYLDDFVGKLYLF